MNKIQLCVICGLRTATTRDHLPPAGIFLKPRPNDLVSVPCCKECNNTASPLDEQFRVFLSMHVAYTHPDQMNFFRQNVLPTLEHNKRLTREIYNNSERVLLRSPSGLFLGSANAIKWDSEAHDRVIERIIRGLHWHHTGEILGDKAHIKVQYLNGIGETLAAIFEPFPLQALGNGQVLYKIIIHKDLPYRSAWLFQFFDRKWSSGHVSPIDDTIR